MTRVVHAQCCIQKMPRRATYNMRTEPPLTPAEGHFDGPLSRSITARDNGPARCGWPDVGEHLMDC